MTRRMRPPKHPMTGNPYVDNDLRNSWRDYRDYLRRHPLGQVALAFSTDITWYGKPIPKPRKARKHIRRKSYAAAFQYHPATYYTPERIILNDPR